MEDQKPTKIISTIGILGTKTTIRTGSFNAKFIPSIYIVTEDKLACEVIDRIKSDITPHSPSCKYLICGSWMNLVSSVYGFLKYGQEIYEGYKIPPFSILAVHDGDIKASAIEKRFNSVIAGDHLTQDQKEIKDKLKQNVIGFSLEHLDYEKITGLPEYNHKYWFEEIQESEILAYHARELEGEDRMRAFLCQRDIDTLLEVITHSASLKFEKEAGKATINYHGYYTALKAYNPTFPDHTLNQIEYYVLRSIQRYNRKKWDFYTENVKSKIVEINNDNYQRFANSNYDLV